MNFTTTEKFASQLATTIGEYQPYLNELYLYLVNKTSNFANQTIETVSNGYNQIHEFVENCDDNCVSYYVTYYGAIFMIAIFALFGLAIITIVITYATNIAYEIKYDTLRKNNENKVINVKCHHPDGPTEMPTNLVKFGSPNVIKQHKKFTDSELRKIIKKILSNDGNWIYSNYNGYEQSEILSLAKKLGVKLSEMNTLKQYRDVVEMALKLRAIKKLIEEGDTKLSLTPPVRRRYQKELRLRRKVVEETKSDTESEPETEYTTDFEPEQDDSDSEWLPGDE